MGDLFPLIYLGERLVSSKCSRWIRLGLFFRTVGDILRQTSVEIRNLVVVLSAIRFGSLGNIRLEATRSQSSTEVQSALTLLPHKFVKARLSAYLLCYAILSLEDREIGPLFRIGRGGCDIHVVRQDSFCLVCLMVAFCCWTVRR